MLKEKRPVGRFPLDADEREQIARLIEGERHILMIPDFLLVNAVPDLHAAPSLIGGVVIEAPHLNIAVLLANGLKNGDKLGNGHFKPLSVRN